jgi:hypothetical protein
VQSIAAASCLIPSFDGPGAHPPDTTLAHNFELDELAKICAAHEPEYVKRWVRHQGGINTDDEPVTAAHIVPGSLEDASSSGQRAHLRRKLYHKMEAILRDLDTDRAPGGLLRELRNTGAVGNPYTTAGNAANAAAAHRKRAKAVR